ncbi:signal peptidase I [Clostridium tarantellae]|uniref:Signal peptidase I n=1 Tax=Clostridium tarantellae TaxID=39493 RepID=A0A6I1MJN0_9CLOT|nr:signal peptidase I [Clostridium tarantellae]MPQ42618.1 signal peptidase I [Clostridium tarantellae]
MGKKIFLIIKYIIITVVTIALLLLIASNFNFKVNKIGAYKFLNVLTGSMEPNIPKESFIIVKSVDKNNISVGDVITYKAKNSNALVTHRVFCINENNEYITKGDANEVLDLHPVEFNRVLGVVVYHIPNLGGVLLLLKENILLLVLGFIFIYFLYILFLKFRS